MEAGRVLGFKELRYKGGSAWDSDALGSLGNSGPEKAQGHGDGPPLQALDP